MLNDKICSFVFQNFGRKSTQSKMRKKVVTDSLLQIAIILSLVRRNIDDYLHVLSGHLNDGELTDVFHGTTSAIAQTENYFSNWDRSSEGFIHPKNVERYMPDLYMRDIYSYRDVRNIVPATIDAYILPELETTANIAHSSHRSNEQLDTVDSSSETASPTGSLNFNWNNNQHHRNDNTLNGYASDSDSGVSDLNLDDVHTHEPPVGDELTLEVNYICG